MSDVQTRPNIFLSIIGWLFLTIVAFVFSRPTLLFPVSFIPVITILLCYSLYTEYPSYRRIAIFMTVLSFGFCILTVIFSVHFDRLPSNLLDLEFNFGYMILLTTWLFVIISGFITIVFILIKVIHRHISAMTMFLSNFIVYLGLYYFLRWYIPILLAQ